MTKKIAIVHDWLVGGGAEKVVEALHELYPDAPIYTSYISEEWRNKLKGADIRTGYLQKLPHLRKFLVIPRQLWFSHLNLNDFDIIISSSGSEAKGLKKTRKDQLHINYCHAPTHYYWSRYESYLQNPGFGPLNWLARIGLKTLIGPMRKWDYKMAQRPDIILANSTHTAKAIKKYYDRESIVVHPPVNIERFKPKHKVTKKDYYIITGRQVPYKNIDLAIRTFNELNKPLLVIGNGPTHDYLTKIAGPSITFRTDVSDEELPSLLQSAKGFIFPGVDDFGIAPVEAMAAGCPVIALKAGGALDTVVENENGLFFNSQNVDALKTTILKFDTVRLSTDKMLNHVRKFNKSTFKKNTISVIRNNLTTKS